MSVKLIARSIWNNPGNRGQRLKRMARAVYWQLWKRIIRTPRVLTLMNGRPFVAHSDCVISSSLIYADLPEFQELRFIRSRLHSQDLVIDVGANVGHIGLLLSDIVKPQHIIAFEPTPVTYQRLRENWMRNHFVLSGLQQVAVGACDGFALFPDSPHPETTNSQITGANELLTVRVALKPLDSYRALWQKKRVELLKIDVEGREVAVFQGAMEMLREDRPRLVMFESLNGHVEKTVAEFLDSAGYFVLQLDEDGRPQRDRSDAQNLFAAPQEKIDEVLAG